MHSPSDFLFGAQDDVAQEGFHHLGFHFGGFANTVTQLHASAGWSTLVFAFVAAIVIAALGSTFATATVVRIRPAEVLRSE